MRYSRLTVEREGVVTLPPEVREAARLRPGDILAIEAQEDGFALEVYRELLDGALEYVGELSLHVSQSGRHHRLHFFHVP